MENQKMTVSEFESKVREVFEQDMNHVDKFTFDYSWYGSKNGQDYRLVEMKVSGQFGVLMRNLNTLNEMARVTWIKPCDAENVIVVMSLDEIDLTDIQNYK